MARNRSPFLVRLKGTASDATNLYMMMEAVMGGELFGYLQVSEGVLALLMSLTLSPSR
jgi:hypothetical protein